MWSEYVLNNVWRDFRLPMSARKSFNGKCTAKIDFPITHFDVTITDDDMKSAFPQSVDFNS